jgi:hypothetical protein
MRIRVPFIAAAVLAVIATLGPAGTAAAAPTAVPATMFSDGCFSTARPIDCTITEPVVNVPQHGYGILFQPGDHVQVIAGGCVQTGGRGKTWKRYVDPASDNDLYHGLITIPGATGDLDRLVNVVGRQFTVFGSGGFLTLGYQDDSYGDNGYANRNDDNGTGNQCLGLGNAFVRIFIT